MANQAAVEDEAARGSSGPEDADPPWHGLDHAGCARLLETDSAQGLSVEEAGARMARVGENRLAEASRRPAWQAFLDQFKSLLILVLIGAAILAGAIGDLVDAAVILVVVIFNALLGFWQEHRAEQTLAALKKMLSPSARVRRSGQILEIPSTQLVPGDLVLLEAGDRVPADGRLCASHDVEIDESALTGESQPVAKDAEARLDPDTPLAERINMAFMNTALTRGRVEMWVTGTGMATQMGRLSGLLSESDSGPTPLQAQLDELGQRLAWVAGGVIALIFALGMLRGAPLVQTILESIALAVAAIPEGLPAVVTVTLALGMHRMAQHRAIVKRLAAVETLGCTTVICSDKTGTLTLNQMTARAVVFQGRRFSVTGDGYDGDGEIVPEDGGEAADLGPLVRAAALANDSRIHEGELIGDPTEGALLALAARSDLDLEALAARHPRLAEVPFDSATRLQASFHEEGDRVRIHVKGAPDVLLARSTRRLTAEGETPIDDAARLDCGAQNERLAEQAMRVLAFAGKTISRHDFETTPTPVDHLQDLTWIGLVGIHDPPRPEARAAIELCRRAGIGVKMITGDHRTTAAAIAEALGLAGRTMEGRELDALDPAELAACVEETAVFARVIPEHKVRIVKALRERGQVVAMTGDGVNDAPAVKIADIGIAMGRNGTDVTREAADMVLTDDNFATIVHAVKEGRGIYDNLIKFVRFQLSTNMGAIQAVLGASLLGWPIPFTAIQILWINIIMDGPPAMSLGVEPARPGIMDEPPRRVESQVLTGGRLLRLFFLGLTMAVGTLALHVHARSEGPEYALSLTFTTFVLFQFFNIFNARAETGSAFNPRFFHNGWLWLSLIAVVGLQVLVVHWPPAQAVFRTTDLSLEDWGLAALVASSVLILEEARKLGARLFVRGT
jgi:Ca2+-transporting ATPase